VWITATRKVVAEAVTRNVFRRGFRQDVKVPADFVERLEERLERHALDALSIAHKAGHVVQGFAKVEAAMTAGPAVAVIHAAEAASDGVRKLAQAGAKARAAAGAAARTDLGAIGFGIGPVKCGTCSPACRARERHVSGALAHPRPFPDEPSERRGCGCGQPNDKTITRRQ
jgi:hypothetical protein